VHGAAAPTGGDGGSGEIEEEECPGGPALGQKAVVTWASIGISKENRDGLSWPLGRIYGLNRRACRNCFQIYFMDFYSNQRVLNIFKPNLNRTQNRIKLSKPFRNFSNLRILNLI
jgi:hypothetical protein